jgi:hypothetical protein
MPRVYYRAVVAAAVLAFVASAVYYILWGPVWLRLRGIDPTAVASTGPQVGEVLGQLVRNLVVAYVLAHFAALLRVADWKGAIRLGLWVWVGFEAMAIVGSVLHEGYPWGLYALHAGDELMSTLLMALVVGVWRPRRPEPVLEGGVQRA